MQLAKASPEEQSSQPERSTHHAMGLRAATAQPNSVSTTNTGISIRVTAAAAISAVAVNIAPPLS
jgi:hypothetical protein